MRLSPRQEAAVRAARGGMFLSAAAGSGKTRVLAERFVRLVNESCSADNEDALASVAAITFTDKAAGEIAERIRGTFAASGELGFARRIDEAWISTIHGLCSRILRRHAFEAGLDPMFAVADEVESGVLRQEAFEAVVREVAEDGAVTRLVIDYNVAELAQCVRDIDEELRCLGVSPSDVEVPLPDLSSVLGEALLDLRDTLSDMKDLAGRRATEEKNLSALAQVVEQLSNIGPEECEAELRVLEALDAFKQNKGCRECAKPLALRAEASATRLRQTATDVASAQYGTSLLDVIERYSARYAALKDARGMLDFEDLQVNTRALLQGHPHIARVYRERFAEVMVDEFQDTNALQVSVIEALSGEALTSVGDEKQSIYGWRNADVEVFRRRAAAVGPGRRFELPENYRSHPELVTFFNGLFTADGFWPDSFMQLEAGLSEPAGAERPVAGATALHDDRPRVSVTLVGLDACVDGGAPATEARAVAESFAEMRAAGVAQGDMVLLLRSMTHVEAFEAAIRSAGFDVFVGSGGAFFDTPETEELEALLRAIANSADDEALARVLAGRMAALSDDSLYLLRQVAGRARTLWDAACSPDRPRLAEVDEAALERVIAVLERARAQRSVLPLYDLLHDVCERLDYDLALLAGGRPRAWANAMKFARLAGRYDEESAGDPAAFLEHLELRRAHKRYEQQAVTAVEGVDAVRIMTVHGAKGLEFPVVAVAGLGSRLRTDRPPFSVGGFAGTRVLGVRLPPIEPFREEARDSTAYTAIRELRVQRDLEEAKRILYVACTRASGALGLFGVIQTEKEPDPSTPIGWLRTALAAVGEDGDRESALDGSEEEISVNGARVVVRRLLAQNAESGDRDAARAGEPADQGCFGPEAGVALMPASGGVTEETSAVDVPPPHTTRPPRRISYSGLKLFRMCGLRYYAGHVARLGSPAGAGDANEALKVGSAVHAALCLCGPEGLPDAGRLEAIARHAGVAPDGRSRVIEATEAFARSDLARRAYGAKVVLHEVPFGVVIGETVLDGSIDLLAKQDEAALIVDYKTGCREPDASTLENWRLQSACYALAALRSGSERVEVVFVQPEAGGATVTFQYSSGDLETIESEIGGIIEAIGSGTFEALEEYDHDACAECPALGLMCVPRNSPRPRAAV